MFPTAGTPWLTSSVSTLASGRLPNDRLLPSLEAVLADCKLVAVHSGARVSANPDLGFPDVHLNIWVQPSAARNDGAVTLTREQRDIFDRPLEARTRHGSCISEHRRRWRPRDGFGGPQFRDLPICKRYPSGSGREIVHRCRCPEFAPPMWAPPGKQNAVLENNAAFSF